MLVIDSLNLLIDFEPCRSCSEKSVEQTSK